MNGRLFFVAALVLLIWPTLGYSFDIAISGDPLSDLNLAWSIAHRYGYTGSFEDYRTRYFNFPDSEMDSVYAWYREMGVTKVHVQYIQLSDFDWIIGDSTHIKLMNYNYPGPVGMRSAKYVDAQYRDVQVGLTREDDGAFWSYRDAVPNPEWRVIGPPTFDETERRPVVHIGPGTESMMWLPTSYLGNMSGWDYTTTGWLDGSIYMPMHFKLTWAVDPTGPISEGAQLADFYWIVRAPNDTVTDEARWWRFPAKTLTLDSLPDTTTWNISEFVDSALAGMYHLLDEEFVALDSIPTGGIHFGPTNPPHGLDDTYLSGLAYGVATEVRMSVRYRGTHNFYLNRIEVYDEGAWRMFAAGEDTTDWQDAIADAFQAEYAYAGSKSAGWYYDEWDLSGGGNGDPVLRSIVKVNKILQTNGLPTFFINGYSGELSDTSNNNTWARNRFYAEENRQNVSIPVQMNEFYFLGAAHACQPPGGASRCGWPQPLNFWTSYSSDTTHYIYAESCGQLAEPCSVMSYRGYKSLQCAIDGSIWEWDPVYTLGDMIPPWDEPGDQWHWYNLRHQVQLRDWRRAHGHEDQFWALIAGASDMTDSTEDCCPIREPQPNEVKLAAWLAVACDVDGIMWYPWTFGGLLEWADVSDTTHTEVQPTERFDAARDVGQDIQRLAPILEGTLEFVRTYASRAFELNYPNDDHEATRLDTLATNCSWHGQNYRAMYGISAFAPSGGGWSSTSETYPYVQVSRFRNRLFEVNDPTREDYWFLVVNRRALSTEQRKIRLAVETDTTYRNNPYYVDYILGDSTTILAPDPSRDYASDTRYLDVILQPGEAELVHFYRGELGCDTTELDVSEVTIHRFNSIPNQLRWEGVGADVYFICGSMSSDGPWTAFAATTDTSFVDSTSGFSTLPEYFYTVQACWDE